MREEADVSYIISSDCMDCGVCEFMCPQDAIYEAKNQFVIRKERCNDCGTCIPYCPARAISSADAYAERRQRTVRNVLGGILRPVGS